MTEQIDLMGEITRAVEEIAQRGEIKHPQVIEGTLYVTPAQFYSIAEWAAMQPLDLNPTHIMPSTSLGGINVVVMHKGDYHRLPSGKILLYSKWLPDSFLIFDEDAAQVPASHFLRQESAT